jgi:signal transduction histidine kinase/FixJ family two-component response regulator
VLGITLKDAGYRLLTAENGEEALAVFRQSVPDIVLTDIKMPGMDGIELLRKIKEESPDTEVIMITGHGDMDLAIKSLKLEATDFVTKPINNDALEIALHRAHERMSMRAQIRDYTENLEKMVAEKSARLVELERLTALGQAVDGLSLAMGSIAENQEGGLEYLNEMPCLVSIHSRALKVVAVNQRYRDQLGDHVGCNSWDIYKRNSKESKACPVESTFASGAGLRCRETILLSEGQEMPVIVHTAPIRNSRNELELVIEIAANISEVRRLQSHLSSLGLMVGSISHGIKGVLTGLDAGIYLLDTGFSKRNKNQSEEGLELVKMMAERIRKVVLDILYYAKNRALNHKKINIETLFGEVMLVVRPKMEKHDVAFSHHFASTTGSFEGDEMSVRLALVNILENAVEACLEETSGRTHRVDFEVTGDEDAIDFRIRDNGIGMTPEIQSNLFTLFYTSKGHMGTGLGLFLAKQIVDQHTGTIHVESELGQGSLFHIRLPRVLPNHVKNGYKDFE